MSGEQAVPEFTVTTTAGYEENTLLMVNANGTYSAADDDVDKAARICAVQLRTTTAAGQTSARLLSSHRTHRLLVKNTAVTDLTVPLTATDGGVEPGGDGAVVAMPLHTAAVGEWVEVRVWRQAAAEESV